MNNYKRRIPSTKDILRRTQGAVNMCLKKRAYKDEAQALMVILNRQKNDVAVGVLRTYHCPICYRWHLTSKPAKEMT